MTHPLTPPWTLPQALAWTLALVPVEGKGESEWRRLEVRANHLCHKQGGGTLPVSKKIERLEQMGFLLRRVDATTKTTTWWHGGRLEEAQRKPFEPTPEALTRAYQFVDQWLRDKGEGVPLDLYAWSRHWPERLTIRRCGILADRYFHFPRSWDSATRRALFYPRVREAYQSHPPPPSLPRKEVEEEEEEKISDRASTASTEDTSSSGDDDVDIPVSLTERVLQAGTLPVSLKPALAQLENEYPLRDEQLCYDCVARLLLWRTTPTEADVPALLQEGFPYQEKMILWALQRIQTLGGHSS